jgi:beta-fructofuranosidase
MSYRPEGTGLKDVWYFSVGEEVHSIFMQHDDLERPDDDRSFCTLGQAVTKDLVSWSPLPIALHGGEPGSYDDRRLHTGCTIEVDGVYYLYHTATGSAQKGFSRIALATSADGVRWEKHPENPILTPDPRFYYNEESVIPLRCHGWPIVDCRDFVVVPDPDGNGYWGFYAARRFGSECAETSCIALCRSTDLVHWEQLPPCFAPDRYACIEVPEVFFLDGRWYMLCLTGNGYGQRNVMADPTMASGTIYAVADGIQGPYHEPEDNVLLGSYCRSLEYNGERVLFYDEKRAISMPTVLRSDSSGGLRACYHHALDAYEGDALVPSVAAPSLPNDGRWGSIGAWKVASESVTGSCRTDWALHVFDETGEDFVYQADVRIRDARSAGLVFRLQGDDVLGGSYAAILDAEAGEVILTRLRRFTTLARRGFAAARGETYALKCVVAGAAMSVYVDEVLLLTTHDEQLTSGRFGLFVERGTAEFSQVTARRLHDAS